MSRSTIYALKVAGKFPQPIRIGSHAVRWIAAEVDAWDRIQTPCLNWPAQPTRVTVIDLDHQGIVRARAASSGSRRRPCA